MAGVGRRSLIHEADTSKEELPDYRIRAFPWAGARRSDTSGHNIYTWKAQVGPLSCLCACSPTLPASTADELVVSDEDGKIYLCGHEVEQSTNWPSCQAIDIPLNGSSARQALDSASEAVPRGSLPVSRSSSSSSGGHDPKEQRQSVNAAFKAAHAVVEAKLKTGSIEVTENIALELHALYQQARHGDNNGIRPAARRKEERAQFDAWSRLQGMSRAAAKRKYCETADQLVTEASAVPLVD
mmetsp:Transcript_27791/g.61367  ORF Transcript_27791/g.61367 Transcript_27791/m.61367 type:complete len:241 (-) Transcript_27791:48-770(-)